MNVGEDVFEQCEQCDGCCGFHINEARRVEYGSMFKVQLCWKCRVSVEDCKQEEERSYVMYTDNRCER